MSNFTCITLPTRGSSVFRKLLSVILLTPAAVFLSAWSFQDGEETVTIKGNDVPLITVFKTIKKQTGYSFFYAADYVNDQVRVSVDVKNAKVEDVLRKVLGGDYVWVYNENAVSITKKKEEVRRRSSLAAASVPDSSVTQITVSGAVMDAKGVPIPGATVIVKGTKDGANTDENGRFSLPGVATNAVLVISSVGFEKMEIPVRGKTILAQLNIDVNNLDEAVVIAYNTTTQKKNVGAVTVIKGEQIETFPSRSVDRSLQGLVPGLQITTGSGLPGAGVTSMTLRGVATGGTIGNGSTVRNPLIVIDGIPVIQDNLGENSIANMPAASNPLAQINPNDIESISVLKDAAAIALYGTRASNGVIMITTKKGTVGKVRVNFRHQTDISSRIDAKRDVLNQDQYLALLYESYKNADPTMWTDDVIKADLRSKFPVRPDSSFYQAANWFDALYTNHALTLSNDIALTGGTEKMTHYLGFSEINQNGILMNTGYDRYSIRYNVTFIPAPWINIGINSTFSYNKQDFGVYNEGLTDPNGFASFVSPLLPVKDDANNYILYYKYGAGGENIANPLARLERNINQFNAYRSLGNAYAEVSFLKHFSFKTNLGADLVNSEVKLKVDRFLDGTPTPGPNNGSVQQTTNRKSAVVITNSLKYNRVFHSKHSINALISQEAQTIKASDMSATGYGYSSSYFDQISNAAFSVGYGSSREETLLSYFAQGNYSYDDRYLVSISGRLDGSSKFGDKVPFGKFWSIGAGWILSDEKFLRKAERWLSYLKLRGSVGVAGNTNSIPFAARYTTLQATSYPDVGPAVLQTIANPEVGQEESLNTDIGIELRLLSERINIIGDIYRRKTTDLLYPVNEPLTSGRREVIANIGEMQNKGIELSFSIDVIRGRNFLWNIAGNWSTNSNKLISLTNAAKVSGGNLNNVVGKTFNSWYLVRWAGVDPSDGKPQWLDSSGKITKIYNYNDRVIVGNPQPDGFGSVSMKFGYKNFEISTLLYYCYGYKVYNSWLSSMINDGRNDPYNNQSTQALDRWQKPGDISANPRRVLNSQDGGNLTSTRYLVDGDYIRFKNLLIAYRLPQSFLQRCKMQNAKVFIQANNIGLWTKSTALDPDNTGSLGENAAGYPQLRSFTIGCNIGF